MKGVSVFSPAQVLDFYQKGYLVFDAGLPHPLLDAAANTLSDNIYKFQDDLLRARRVQDLYKEFEAVRELATFFLPHVEFLYGGSRKPFCFQTLNFLFGTEQAAHADTIHFDSLPSGWMCGVWIALEDIHDDAGPLEVYPGTHALPHLNRFDARAENYTGYETWLKNKLQSLNLKPVRLVMKKGEAIIWAANLIHGGSERKNKTLTRLSQVNHYFFEGCKYFTSVGTDPSEDIEWRIYHPQGVLG